MRLLVVEDEKSIAEAIQALLADKGYSVDLAFDGDDGLEYILTGLYDLVLLDIMLPKRSGLSVLKRVREAGLETPIIFLTAKSQTYDKVNGLDLGADDYITKPFEANQLRLGNIRLNTDSHELESKESSVKLSNKEFLLMEVFMRNAKQIIPKNQLISKVWGPSDNSEYNQLEVFISFLRKKLRFLKADIEIITTKGFGYSLEERT